MKARTHPVRSVTNTSLAPGPWPVPPGFERLRFVGNPTGRVILTRQETARATAVRGRRPN